MAEDDRAAPEFALFATAIGRCGIAWSGRGILAVQLPEASERAMRARLRRELPGARSGEPPPAVRQAIAALVALLEGEARDLSAIPLDMARVPPFHRSVYEVARTIAPGRTTLA